LAKKVRKITNFVDIYTHEDVNGPFRPPAGLKIYWRFFKKSHERRYTS